MSSPLGKSARRRTHPLQRDAALAGPRTTAGLIVRLYRGAQGPALNPLLGATALYQTALTLLLIVGLALPGS